MIEIKNCPSSLREGFDTYSPKGVKRLFGISKVSPILDFHDRLGYIAPLRDGLRAYYDELFHR